MKFASYFRTRAQSLPTGDLVPLSNYIQSSECVLAALYKLFGLFLNHCKYFGLTIFSLRPDNSLGFSITSLPTLFATTRFFFTVFDAIFEKFIGNILENIAESSTHSFVLRVLSGCLYLSEVTFVLLQILQSRKIIPFHKNLTDFILALSNLEHASDKMLLRQFCVEEIEQTFRYTSLVKRIIIGIFLSNCFGLTVFLVQLAMPTIELRRIPGFYFFSHSWP